MLGIIVIILIILFGENLYHPRIDRINPIPDEETGVISHEYLLWYGLLNSRKNIRLFRI
jgi:hypothetical protein